MKKIDIKQLYNSTVDYDGKEVLVGGWIKSVRDLKNFAFMEINDGSAFKGVQIILQSQDIENYATASKLNAGSSVLVKGKLVVTPQNKQPFEILAKQIDILSATDQTYPLQKKRHTVEYLREHAYLRARTNLFNATFRVRSEVSFALHNFFNQRGFVYVHTPIITALDCEGGSDVFRVTTFDPYNPDTKQKALPENDFFGKKVFLTPTGQLEGEAMALAFGKVYTFGPTFRSENSNTARHASEFWMVEPEIAFCNLNGLIDFIEEMVKYLISYLFEKCSVEIDFFDAFVEKGLKEKLKSVLENDFEKITYTKAIEILENSGQSFEFKPHWGMDLQSEHERYICEKVYNKPVFVTDYPSEIKAFYMKLNQDGKTVAACDLLVPGIGEMVGGSQREDDYDTLYKKTVTANLNPEDYWWYLNLRKFGGVPHSGFGLGLERFLMYATGVSNIRDVQLFSRTPNNCDF